MADIFMCRSGTVWGWLRISEYRESARLAFHTSFEPPRMLSRHVHGSDLFETSGRNVCEKKAAEVYRSSLPYQLWGRRFGLNGSKRYEIQ